jgi:hypothetical protein
VPGTPLVIRNLATGRTRRSESVSRSPGRTRAALAFAITVDGGVGNGLQLYDTADRRLRTLDSSRRPTPDWRGAKTRVLAALRSATAPDAKAPTHTLLVWADVSKRAMKALDATHVSRRSAGVRFRTPQWSEDGAGCFVGVGPWCREASADAVDRSRRIVATQHQP